VEIVGAGGGAHVDVGAAGGTLLGVVHGSVDAKFFDGIGRGSGESLADGEIGRGGALERLGGSAGDAGGAADAGVVDDAGAGDLTGAFAVEEIAGVNPVEEECVAGVALAIRPDGEIAEAGVDARAAGEFGVDAGRENGDAGKAAGGKRNGLELGFLENVAVGGVDGVHQGAGFNGDGGADLADFEDGVDGGGAIGLHDDGWNSLGFEAVVGEGESVGADGKVYKIVAADAGGFLCAGKLRVIGDDGDGGIGENAAGGVRDRASDAAESLLGKGIEREEERQANTKTR